MSRKSGRARALVPVVGSPSLLILLVVAPGVGMRSPGAGGHMGAPPRPALLHALPLPTPESQLLLPLVHLLRLYADDPSPHPLSPCLRL